MKIKGSTVSEVSMIRQMCGLKERKRNAEIREMLGLEPVSLLIGKGRFR